jgi:hypothetical protein
METSGVGDVTKQVAKLGIESCNPLLRVLTFDAQENTGTMSVEAEACRLEKVVPRFVRRPTGEHLNGNNARAYHA